MLDQLQKLAEDGSDHRLNGCDLFGKLDGFGFCQRINRRDKCARFFGALDGSCRSLNLLPDLLRLVWQRVDRNGNQRLVKGLN